MPTDADRELSTAVALFYYWGHWAIGLRALSGWRRDIGRGGNHAHAGFA
jgi:hypothetical protein